MSLSSTKRWNRLHKISNQSTIFWKRLLLKVLFHIWIYCAISKEHPPMPYNYAWAVADPEAGLDFGQVPFPTPFPVPVPGTFSNNPVQLTDSVGVYQILIWKFARMRTVTETWWVVSTEFFFPTEGHRSSGKQHYMLRLMMDKSTRKLYLILAKSISFYGKSEDFSWNLFRDQSWTKSSLKNSSYPNPHKHWH